MLVLSFIYSLCHPFHKNEKPLSPTVAAAVAHPPSSCTYPLLSTISGGFNFRGLPLHEVLGLEYLPLLLGSCAYFSTLYCIVLITIMERRPRYVVVVYLS